jgi:hypothetical protein
MTEVELLQDFAISPDGMKVEIWPKGCTKMVADDVLRILIGEGACAIVERQAFVAAPENKAAKRSRKGKK